MDLRFRLPQLYCRPHARFLSEAVNLRSGGPVALVVCLFSLLGHLTVLAQTVVINEIMFHPGLGRPGYPGYVPEDLNQEFVELLNIGSKPVRLKGWQFDQGISFVFPDVTLAPGGFLVITADRDVARFKAAYAARYPAVGGSTVLGGWTGKLSDNGEEIELVDAAGERVDSVRYATEGDWALRREGEPYPGKESWWRGWRWANSADAGGKSLELIYPQLPNDTGQNWTASLTDGGTPGGPNSAAQTAVAPFILDVQHRPAVPKSTDPVAITARLVSMPGISATVTLFCHLDGAGEFVSTPMWDDGAHHDGAAGDGLYGARLEPLPDRTIVEFYVQAAAAGLTRTWPSPTDAQGTHGANALYQVDDAAYGGTQPIYRLIIPQAEYKAWTDLMDSTSGGQFSDAAMHGAWVATDSQGTEIRYNVSIRNRGAGTRVARPHNFHVNIPNDTPWHGMSKMALNTRTVHAQVAGNAACSLAGLVNTYGTPVQVRINGLNQANLTPTGDVNGFQFGSYYAFQPYGSEWARVHIPDDPDASIYKAVWYFDGLKLKNNGGTLQYLGDDPVAYRLAYTTNGPTSETGAYTKQSNVSEDDWSDLIGLTKVLSTAPDATYLEQVEQVVNVDQWLRYLAVNSLIGNMETTLATGTGDDYSLFAGKRDPRFQLLPHDLDTVLGQGDTAPDYGRSIFRAADMPVLARFLKHPAIAPRYYAVLRELTDTVFTPDVINPLLDQWLGGWVPDSVVQRMKDFVVQRRAGVLAQIPLGLTLTHTLPVAGYPRTDTNSASLRGLADAIRTRSVLVNGAPAAWTAWSASWAADAVPLNPGLNRVVVQALDAAGQEIDRSSIDLWYDSGTPVQLPGGVLAADSTWTAAGGPYLLTAPLTVPPGATLSIAPGTTVYFSPEAGLTVNGRLLAEGTPEQRIRLTRLPGSDAHWVGLRFVNASSGSVLACVDIEYADAQAQVIDIDQSQVLLDRVTAAHNDAQTLNIRRPQVIIRNSVFHNPGAHSTITVGEMLPEGWFILEGNLFDAGTSEHDVLRLHRVSLKDGPVAQVRDNVFLGGSGNLVANLETDTHLEGNLFMRAHPGNSGSSAFAAVTTGPAANGTVENLRTQHLTLVRNAFFENDYGLLLRAGAYAELYNNVFVANRGALLFDEPWRADSSPGRGCSVESCIFYLNQPENDANGSGTFVHLLNRSPSGHSQLTVHHSLVPALFHSYGAGNLEADPRFVRPSADLSLNAAMPRFSTGFDGFSASPGLLESGGVPDLRLAAGSPALGAGFNGVDMGCYVSSRASLAGLPSGTTFEPYATATVGGTDLAGYRYRLIGPGLITNDWSAERGAVKTVVFLESANGMAVATVPGHGYANGDVIQVYGAEPEAYNGLVPISNVTADTFSYPVPGSPPAPLPPLDIRCRKSEPIPLQGLADGSYTLQVIRKNSLGIWQDASQPTSHSWTVQAGLVPLVRLNEILAGNGLGASLGAIELYNPAPVAMDLSGLGLSSSLSNPWRFRFPSGTTLPGGQYLVVWANDVITIPGLHLGFTLRRQGDALYLSDALDRGGAVLDSVVFGPQLPDYSIGRLTDGSWGLTRPTLGERNQRAPLGDPANLVINEWLAQTHTLPLTPFIELFNLDPNPVPLAGLALLPRTTLNPNAARIPALSFVGGHSFTVFYPDGKQTAGADHLDFALGSASGALGLFGPAGQAIDVIVYPAPLADQAQGRSPDGAAALVALRQPTPGGWNALPPGGATNVDRQVFGLVSLTNAWRYNQLGIDLGTMWQSSDYDDDAWAIGQALLYAGSNTYPVPANTELSLEDSSGKTIITYYFRTRFNLDPSLASAVLEAYLTADDGAIVYLNGALAFSRGMPTDEPVTYATRASRTVGTVRLEGPFTIPAGLVRPGDNLLAVEVHQVSSSSHDIAFALSLQATLSTTNVVAPSGLAALELSEVLARNRSLPNAAGQVTDWVELHNTSAQPLDLSGVSLTDTSDQPRKWVFPSGSMIPADGYLVVNCSNQQPPTASNTGFSLNATGGAVCLFAPPAQGNGLLDSIYYGVQVPDLSLSRSESGDWSLSQPTPGAPNVFLPLSSPADLRINEWMANPEIGPDWFELFNPGLYPVELSGLYLNDDLTQPGALPIPAFSYIGAGPDAYLVFIADEDLQQGANHTAFKLSASGEAIGLFTSDGWLIDAVTFGPQTEGVSQGRWPDGSEVLTAFPGHPTPGAANGANALKIRSARMTADGFQLSFETVPGQSYTVQFKDNLQPGLWSKLTDVPPTSTGGPVNVLDPVTTSSWARYYRIVSPLIP